VFSFHQLLLVSANGVLDNTDTLSLTKSRVYGEVAFAPSVPSVTLLIVSLWISTLSFIKLTSSGQIIFELDKL
jgi:hypothetical protein